MNDGEGYGMGELLFTDFMRFTMANVSGGSPRLWVHCFAIYLLTGIVVRELLVEYNAFNNIRHRYLLSREAHLRTVLVTNIPRHLRAPSKITTYFKNVYPEAVKSVTICQNLIRLEKLVQKRTHILTAIEKELLVLCRSEKRKLVITTLSAFDRVKFTVTNLPKKLLSCVGCSDGQERLAWLYSKLEELNDGIEKEHVRRDRVMKTMDALQAAEGSGDIDYVLAVSQGEGNHVASGDSDVMMRRNGKKRGQINLVNGNIIDDDDNNGKEKDDKSFAKDAIYRYSQELKARNFLGRLRPTEYHDSTDPSVHGNNGKFGYIENHTNEVTDKAFVVMRTFTASTIAIQSMHSSKPGSMQVSTAPEPRDLLWENIYVSKGAKKTRSLIADALVLLLISFYIIPVAIISLLVSENALVSYSPRIAQLDQASALFSSAIAIVQPLCLVGIQQLLPPLFIFIGKCEGIISFSEVQMKAFSRYFMFQILNIFLVTAIAGSIFDTLAIIIENPEAALLMLGNSLPRMSSFFITFVTMKTFLGLGVELVRTVSVIQSLLRLVFCPLSTLRQKRSIRCGCRSIDDPGWFPFHKILAQDMLVVVISVVFAVVAPIVLLPCALFCLFSRILWTHHHLYVFESVFETGGQFWPKIFRRFVFGLVVAQATITGQFILKEARHEAYATIALLCMTYFFLRSTRARYDNASSTLPLEVATCMDISVKQEEEEARRRRDDANDVSHHDIDDPWDLAYVQPALRATSKAKPEQPFPPAQLGRAETFLSGTDDDQHGTVRLNSLSHKDRVIIDGWWNEQIRNAGKQKIFNVLIGEESGTLRVGRSSNRRMSEMESVANANAERGIMV
eukprot:CAMPEP_0116008806 /NCGR_PEP_ID=MMETSP0321-20121206/3071_1 /TAXON_ID=163516 /ORGANISM="Leptocylindrus danicus var. danicus, Strain B650" /LENGTH=846 /DNA_ID=CAMNT_0003477677 /DNA_START=349 /DNA_END=2889 /DNA_ORIENTATION=-